MEIQNFNIFLDLNKDLFSLEYFTQNLPKQDRDIPVI